MQYKGLDYLNIKSLLSEEEIMIMENTRKWVEKKIIPNIGEYFQKAEFPPHLAKEMGELGLFGMTLPAEYGCAGASYTEYGIAMQELERGDSGARSFASVQSSLVMYPIFMWGSEEQKKYWLPQMATAEKIGCFGLTEPDYGSNPGGLITRARKKGKSYILNGAKMWITNGTIADVSIVWAKDDDNNIRGFLVEKDRPGFSAPEIHNKMSLRASITSELVLDDCEIPEENVLPGTTGLKQALMCLNNARYGIAWGGIGAAMACYDEALRYSQERVQFGKPIAGFQITQEKLVYMLTEITKMQFMTLQVGRLMDKGEGKHTHVSLIKRNNIFHALEIARLARDMLGANGITTEFGAIRHMNNLESVKTYEGTHDIHTLILGNDITGIPAFE
ncbi:MAG: acyl-CoA dehydrogenase [bacterium]|nr:acyl-CoA dehydrogenase [bacterium]